MAYVKNSMINIPGFGLTPRAEPNSASAGQIYYDATADLIYGYDGTSWVALSNQYIASGGDITIYTAGGVTYMVHTFLTSGTFISPASGSIDYLVVAGGGGAGAWGGGGAGGGAPTGQPFNPGAGGNGGGGAGSNGG